VWTFTLRNVTTKDDDGRGHVGIEMAFGHSAEPLLSSDVNVVGHEKLVPYETPRITLMPSTSRAIGVTT
jgi:hypothetical protein